MVEKILRKKYGMVIILDALGASEYSEQQIKQFLSSRQELNEILDHQAGWLTSVGGQRTPSVFTFGDTIIITIALSSKKKIRVHIFGVVLLMQNYLYNSLHQGILFRGAFSIGSYIEDLKSNTVMGEAVSDAVSWYAKSEWMGLASTPKTNNTLEYLFDNEDLNKPRYFHGYRVPIKDGTTEYLYTVSWAGRFFDRSDPKFSKDKPPAKMFLEALKKFSVPYGTARNILHLLRKK